MLRHLYKNELDASLSGRIRGSLYINWFSGSRLLHFFNLLLTK